MTDDVAAWAALVEERMQSFVEMMPDDLRDTPGEISLYAYLPRCGPGVSVLLGTALWDGQGLSCLGLRAAVRDVVGSEHRATRRQYVYAVVRAVLRVPPHVGLRYTYLLPPDDVRYVDLPVDSSGDAQSNLLGLDGTLAIYADAFL